MRSPSVRSLFILSIAAAAIIGAELVWIRLDQQPPPWDQASYLDQTLSHADALRSDGLAGFFDDVMKPNVHAPLLTMLATPVFLIAGDGPDQGTSINLLP